MGVLKVLASGFKGAANVSIKDITFDDRVKRVQDSVLSSIIKHNLVTEVMFTGQFVGSQYDVPGRRVVNDMDIIVSREEVGNMVLTSLNESDVKMKSTGIVTDIQYDKAGCNRYVTYMLDSNVLLKVRICWIPNYDSRPNWLSVCDGKYSIVTVSTEEVRSYMVSKMIFEDCSYELMYDNFCLSLIYKGRTMDCAYLFGINDKSSNAHCDTFGRRVMHGVDFEQQAEYYAWCDENPMLNSYDLETFIDRIRSLCRWYLDRFD